MHTLILDKNGLAGLAGFPAMPTLAQLWFNNNAAEDLAAFCDDVARLFPALTWLSFMRNPAAPPLVCQSEEDAAAAGRYRLYVVFRLPKLQFLDAQPVTPAERAEAAKRGQFLAARRPKAGDPGAGPPSRGNSSSGVGGGGGGGGGGGFLGMFSGGAAGGGGGGGAAGGAGAAAPQPKKPTAYLAVGRQEYNGKHSEGNRFITVRMGAARANGKHGAARPVSHPRKPSCHVHTTCCRIRSCRLLNGARRQ